LLHVSELTDVNFHRAKRYCLGCLSRVGIDPPEVTITADDKRLKRGKPFPDPFILAAESMGYDVKYCLVVEDSPSGIRAGVASGATVIAVATSHRKSRFAPAFAERERL
jgi:beta-phosphoglucomutase-like phosphatase (HAD superfamily)